MKIGIVAITAGGKRLAKELAERLDGARYLEPPDGQKIAETFAAAWARFDALICIMATGIVVRTIVPLLQDKMSDPCVVVMDEKGRHAISLLGGHLGGGNELARRVAGLTGGEPIITTASDTSGLVAIDLWAQEQDLFADRQTLTAAAGILVNRGELRLFSEVAVHGLPPGVMLADDVALADGIVSSSTRFDGKKALIFRPRNLVVGAGCNRGTGAHEFEAALDELFAGLQLSRNSIRNLASIDKKNDEKGLLRFAADNRWRIDFYSGDRINSLIDQAELDISSAALKAVGAIGVAEPAAILSAAGVQSTVSGLHHGNLLLSRKRKWKNVTLAVAEAPFSLSAQVRDRSSR